MKKKILIVIIFALFITGCLTSTNSEDTDQGDWVCKEYYCYWEDQNPFVWCDESVCMKDKRIELIYPQSYPQVPMYPNATIVSWGKQENNREKSYNIYFATIDDKEIVLEVLTLLFEEEGWGQEEGTFDLIFKREENDLETNIYINVGQEDYEGNWIYYAINEKK